VIVPVKHVKLNESILGLSGILINLIQGLCNIDDLFLRFKKDKRVPKHINFDDFLLVVNFFIYYKSY